MIRPALKLLLATAVINAQPAFEAASVKPSGPQSVRNSDGGPGTRNPERFLFTGAVLRDLLFSAYGLDNYQQQISGPGWIDTEKYDIVVKIPPGATKEQFQQMLRSLLTERFRLVVHHETKLLPVYELVVGKNGTKLKESAEDPNAVAPGAGAPPVVDHDRDGFPVLPAGRPGLISSFGPGPHSRWRASQQRISALTRSLGFPTAAGRFVIDKTGLTGKYDFTLEYDMQGGPPDDNPNLTIFDAVQQQLGLRLVDAKAPFDVVVVDRAERVPGQN